jgi:hypothetical protein
MIGADAPVQIGMDDAEVAIEQRRKELRLPARSSDDGRVVQVPSLINHHNALRVHNWNAGRTRPRQEEGELLLAEKLLNGRPGARLPSASMRSRMTVRQSHQRGNFGRSFDLWL